MSINSNIVKITAKTALKGNFLKAIICSTTILFCFIINYYTSSLVNMVAGDIISEIFSILLSGFAIFPLFIGILRWFWRMILGIADNPISVYYYFSSKKLYLKTIKLLFAIVIKLLPIAVIVFLPAVFVWLLSQSFIFDFFDLSIPLWSRNLEYAIIFTKTLSTVIVSLISLRYYIAPILFVSNDEIEVFEALHMSAVISKKSALDFIYLIFSFLGWILISVFALPLIFTVPYMLTAYVVHIRFVIAEYNNHIENIKTEQYPSFTVGA